MWARFRRSMTSNATDQSPIGDQCLNMQEEYLNAFRTQSYGNFLAKAKLLIDETTSSSYSSHISEALLEPCQDAISNILESASSSYSKDPDLKRLVLDYFDISAEASRICSHLLQSINQTQSNHRFIQRALQIIGDHSPVEFKSAISELDSFSRLNNPFTNPNQLEFKLINKRYSSILHHLKSKRRKVARMIKLIKCLKQGSRVCFTAACGVVGVVVVILAVHILPGLLLGPVVLGFSPSILKKKFLGFRSLRGGFLRKLKNQLDIAAKGTYILNRDFDTMSRLVTRLHDEIEHNKVIIRFCLERKEDEFPLKEAVKELRKSDHGFMEHVEELEDHVYLCLVTINRARALVIKEMTTPYVESVER